MTLSGRATVQMPKLTPAQRNALREALKERAGYPERTGRIAVFGRAGDFYKRLVEAGVAEYRYIRDDGTRAAITREIGTLVALAEGQLTSGFWHEALDQLNRARNMERTRDAQGLYVTDLGRQAAA